MEGLQAWKLWELKSVSVCLATQGDYCNNNNKINGVRDYCVLIQLKDIMIQPQNLVIQ